MVGFGLGGDGKLGNLLRGLVTLDSLTRAFDIEDERVISRRCMESGVTAIARAAAVEAEEAYVETTRVVLDSSQLQVLGRLLKLSRILLQSNRSTACSLRGIRTA